MLSLFPIQHYTTSILPLCREWLQGPLRMILEKMSEMQGKGWIYIFPPTVNTIYIFICVSYIFLNNIKEVKMWYNQPIKRCIPIDGHLAMELYRFDEKSALLIKQLLIKHISIDWLKTSSTNNNLIKRTVCLIAFIKNFNDWINIEIYSWIKIEIYSSVFTIVFNFL